MFTNSSIKWEYVILMKDFTWKQSQDAIHIRVPLRGVHSTKVDIFTSEKFLKLHYPPFLFEVYLSHSIKENEGVCTFTDTEALIELPKLCDEQWTDLEGVYDKAERLALKQTAIVEVQNKTRKILDNRIQKKTELNQFVISTQIEMDSKKSQKIKATREKEKDDLMKDLESWRKLITDENVKENIAAQPINIKSKAILPKSDVINYSKNNSFQEKIIPPLRNGGTLNITFSERIFPTPSRESSAREEQIWLKKMNEARKASGFISEDLRPEERDPQWCKDKGDELFRKGNHMGALNAYTHGLKLSDKLPSLYSNRAAVHYAMGNFHKCIEDCSAALDLMTPKCQANLKSRITCIVRRAAGLTRIGMLSKAIDEMKCAVKLQPDNDVLKADLIAMEKAWEQDPDSD
ncbi:dynein axonemal assembly factor 4-like [Arctopsyche grandis]|uniref:dynein axonemal assembly factor 4-like n=1 Tax=Arctopsyche grandis TaxID=121162 RepID=UPI00406D7BC5